MYVDWVFSFDFGLVNFLDFACTCARSNSQLSSIRISFFGFVFFRSPPTVLILGHSFVRRLSSDLRSNFDPRAAEHFNLLGDAVIHLHGVGGRTVKKPRLYDLGVVSALSLTLLFFK